MGKKVKTHVKKEGKQTADKGPAEKEGKRKAGEALAKRHEKVAKAKEKKVKEKHEKAKKKAEKAGKVRASADKSPAKNEGKTKAGSGPANKYEKAIKTEKKMKEKCVKATKKVE